MDGSSARRSIAAPSCLRAPPVFISYDFRILFLTSHSPRYKVSVRFWRTAGRLTAKQAFRIGCLLTTDQRPLTTEVFRIVPHRFGCFFSVFLFHLTLNRHLRHLVNLLTNRGPGRIKEDYLRPEFHVYQQISHARYTTGKFHLLSEPARFPCMERRRMLRVLRLRGMVWRLALAAAVRVAFPTFGRGRHPVVVDFGAQWLACPFPCQCSACGLATACA